MDIITPRKIVKTRKDRMCFACVRWFPKRTEMVFAVLKHDGKIYSSYTCRVCDDLLDQFEDMFIDDVEGLFPEACVSDVLSYVEYDGKTPEDLLENLTKK